jgi:hypothetical protein
MKVMWNCERALALMILIYFRVIIHESLLRFSWRLDEGVLACVEEL